jgi:hypothetical protein
VRRLHLYVVGFGRPDLLREQARLLDEHLLDPYTLTLVDNTADPNAAQAMMITCETLGVPYLRVRSEKHEHPDGLTLAAKTANRLRQAWWGCLDHDIFPARSTALLEKIERAGFFGLAQTYAMRQGLTTHRYLWPGWCFFSRAWLNGRVPDFYGIRGEHAWDDGDAGSMLHTLFTDEDWVRLAPTTHGYGEIRPRDGHGLQSYGYERIGDWLHLSNASRWKAVPDPEGRDMIFREMLAAL